MYSISNDACNQRDEIKYKYSDTIKIIASFVVAISDVHTVQMKE